MHAMLSLCCHCAVGHPDKSLEYFRAVGDAEVPLGNMKQATSADDVTAAINAATPTVVFHSASWCGKCRMVRVYVQGVLILLNLQKL